MAGAYRRGISPVDRESLDDAPDYSAIEVERDDGIVTLTLSRADRMNAFTVRMALELLDAFDRIDADPEVRVLIMTGAGRAFCAGADMATGGATFDADDDATKDAMSGFAAGLDPRLRREIDPRRDFGGMVTLRLYSMTKPVIAAINGAAAGVGATMTLPMDLRLASTSARFGFVFAARGIVPEACSSWFLPRIVGIQTALEWCYTARVFPAAEAADAGLVRSLHEPDDLLPAARELASSIAASAAPLSVALTRQMMWRNLAAPHPMWAHRVDSPGVTSTGSGADAREGIKAFFDKRPPVWSQSVPDDLPDWYPWWEEPSFDP